MTAINCERVRKLMPFISAFLESVAELKIFSGDDLGIDITAIDPTVLSKFSDHSVYARCTSLPRFCGFSPFCCFVESITSDLLTWFARNLSAFYFKTGGCDRIIHLELGPREQRVCFVECVTKGFEDTGPMWRTERG